MLPWQRSGAHDAQFKRPCTSPQLCAQAQAHHSFRDADIIFEFLPKGHEEHPLSGASSRRRALIAAERAGGVPGPVTQMNGSADAASRRKLAGWFGWLDPNSKAEKQQSASRNRPKDTGAREEVASAVTSVSSDDADTGHKIIEKVGALACACMPSGALRIHLHVCTGAHLIRLHARVPACFDATCGVDGAASARTESMDEAPPGVLHGFRPLI